MHVIVGLVSITGLSSSPSFGVGVTRSLDHPLDICLVIPKVLGAQQLHIQRALGSWAYPKVLHR